MLNFKWDFLEKLKDLNYYVYSTHQACTQFNLYCANLPKEHFFHNSSEVTPSLIHFTSHLSLQNFLSTFEDIWMGRPSLSSWKHYNFMEQNAAVLTIFEHRLQEWVARLLLDQNSIITTNFILFILDLYLKMVDHRPGDQKIRMVMRTLSLTRIWTRKEIILLLCGKNAANWFANFWSSKLLSATAQNQSLSNMQVKRAWCHTEVRGDLWIDSFSYLKLWSITEDDLVLPMVIPSLIIYLFDKIRFFVETKQGITPALLIIPQFAIQPSVFQTLKFTLSFPAHFLLPSFYHMLNPTVNLADENHNLLFKNMDLGSAHMILFTNFKTKWQTLELHYDDDYIPWWSWSAKNNILNRQKNSKLTGDYMYFSPVSEASSDDGIVL